MEVLGVSADASTKVATLNKVASEELYTEY